MTSVAVVLKTRILEGGAQVVRGEAGRGTACAYVDAYV